VTTLGCHGDPEAVDPVAEVGRHAQGIPYVFAAYCPAVLPSPHHAPPPLSMRGNTPAPTTADYRELWTKDARRWNDTWGTALDAHRASAGLPPVEDVRSHVLTGRPWLAADPTLAPGPTPRTRPCSRSAPGSCPMIVPSPPSSRCFSKPETHPSTSASAACARRRTLAQVMTQAARALGRRAIVSRGWANLSPMSDDPDCLAIDDVNQQALFPSVAAVVHHGGAGTTTAAALAGAPQVVVPQIYDQHYWAQRIGRLGIGTAHPPGAPTTDSLLGALEDTLRPGVAERARAVAAEVRSDGARNAAERLEPRGFT